jgi:hypothetical protein
MAKPIAIDFSALFAPAAVNGGVKPKTAVAAAAPVLAKRKLADCAASFIRPGWAADKKVAAELARELLAAQGVNVADKAAVREILFPLFWRQGGQTGYPAKGVTDESIATYNTLYARARRMAAAIAGEPETEPTEVVVPRALKSAVKALVAAGYTKKQLLMAWAEATIS